MRRPCTGLALATFLGWLVLGASWQTALTYAIAVLIITCPCALALAVPAVQIAAASRLFRQGIVVKAADGLERVAETDMVVFDKTGTLTLGRPTLLDQEQIPDRPGRGCVARRGEHASLRACDRRRGDGSARRRSGADGCRGDARVRAQALPRPRRGATGLGPWCGIEGSGVQSEVWYCRNGDAPVCFRFADALRSDAAETARALKRRGLPLALLSGDRKGAVEAAADAVGIATWKAELPPAAKIEWLEKAAREGRKVLMVGDGLNDAPALAAAHASISPASAADISQRTADFVFQGEKLVPVVEIIATARRARRMALQNFGVAFAYNFVRCRLPWRAM